MFSSLIKPVLFVSEVVTEVSVTEEWSLEEGWGDICAYSMRLHPEREGTVELADCDSLFSLRWQSGILMCCCDLDSPFCLSLFSKWVCHTFLISLSVLPGNLDAIADHLENGRKFVWDNELDRKKKVHAEQEVTWSASKPKSHDLLMIDIELYNFLLWLPKLIREALNCNYNSFLIFFLKKSSVSVVGFLFQLLQSDKTKELFW